MADQINDEIDLIALLKSLLKKKKLILKLTLIGGLIGLIVGLLTPKTYTSSVTFILQQSDGKQLNSYLGGLASLAGINLNSGSNSSIAPVIYPEILKSYPFKKSLISKEVFVDGESLTYKEYNLNKIYLSLNKLTFNLTLKVLLKLRKEPFVFTCEKRWI